MHNLPEKDFASEPMDADDGVSVPSSQKSEITDESFEKDNTISLDVVKKVSDINEVTRNIAEEETVLDKNSRLEELGKLKSTGIPDTDVIEKDDRQKNSTDDNTETSILDLLLTALDSTNDSKLAFDKEIKSPSEATVKKSKVEVNSIFKCFSTKYEIYFNIRR